MNFNSLFNPQNKFFRAFEKCFDLFVLNFCFLLSILPLFTLGAARLAMAKTILKMEDESLANLGVFRTYFSLFRDGFTLGLKIGLSEIFISFLAFFNLTMLTRGEANLALAIKITSIASILLANLIFLNLYMLLAKDLILNPNEDDRVKNKNGLLWLLYNSFLYTCLMPKKSLSILVFSLGILAFGLAKPATLILFASFLIIIGLAFFSKSHMQFTITKAVEINKKITKKI